MIKNAFFIHTVPLARRISRFSDRLRESNQKGFLTLVVAGAGVCFLIGYLGITYWAFAAGFEMQNEKRISEELREKITLLEIEARTKEAKLGKEEDAVLGSMEKISAIRYISSSGVALVK